MQNTFAVQFRTRNVIRDICRKKNGLEKELLAYKNNKKSMNPTFNPAVKHNLCTNQNGLTVYYSNQCPYTDYYTNTILKELAKKANIPLNIINIATREDALNCPSPFTQYSVFLNGKFITHDILNENKFNKIIQATEA